MRSGYLTLQAVADYFSIPYPKDPQSGDPISILRSEFDALVANLQREGLSLHVDRDKAWKDYSGWRVNYDQVLIALAERTQAPAAPWSSDRKGRIPNP